MHRPRPQAIRSGHGPVPVGLAAGLLSLHLVPPSRPTAGNGRELDLPGALLVTAGLVTGVYALTSSSRW